MDDGACFGDYISFWNLGEFIKVECNGIELLAKEVEIRNMDEFKGEWISATI